MGHPVTPLNYVVVALILIGAMSAVFSLGRLWRHRSAHGFDVGAVSQRWLSEIRREDES
jgi:hypothetical protein